jgi:hypothetical protein
LAAAIGLSHPLAAAIAVGGGAIIIAPMLKRASAMPAVFAASSLIAAAVPMLLALLAIGDHPDPGYAAQVQPLDLYDRLMFQDFSRLDESLATAPLRLFGVMPAWARYGFFALALATARLGPRMAGMAWQPRPAALLLFALFAVYLVTPFSLFWPTYWFVVQPRLLPLAWVVSLAYLGGGSAGMEYRCAAFGMLAVAIAGLLAIALPFWAFACDARDFRAIVAASAPRARTLALIEQEAVEDRSPARPFRHFAGYLVAERGGWASHLPVGTFTGILAPVVRPADAPALPPAPFPGRPRSFDWWRHRGWDQFLIFDSDPEAAWDYFFGHAADVELLARAGHWRLYRSVAGPGGEGR